MPIVLGGKKMSNLKKIRERKGVTQTQLAIAVGTDKYMISKFENNVCLPVPLMTKRICSFLETDLDKIWKRTEIYITPRNLAQERHNELNRAIYYNFSCRLSKECCNVLQQDKLTKLGYSSKKDWLLKQIERFEQEFSNFEKMQSKRRA